MDTNKKECSNCKYFVQHHIILNGTLCAPKGLGHCVCDSLYKSKRNRCLSIRSDCGYWETNEEQMKTRLEDIKNCLRKMAKQLDEIALILKEDN